MYYRNRPETWRQRCLSSLTLLTSCCVDEATRKYLYPSATYILTVNQGESIAFYLQQKLIVLMVRETFQSRSNRVVELTAITAIPVAKWRTWIFEWRNDVWLVATSSERRRSDERGTKRRPTLDTKRRAILNFLSKILRNLLENKTIY